MEVTGAPRDTVESWAKRDSIPPKYWQALVEKRLATMTELTTYSAVKAKAQ